MDNDALRNLLELVQQGGLDLEGAMARLKKLPFENLGYARIDNHRSLRNGVPRSFFARAKPCRRSRGSSNAWRNTTPTFWPREPAPKSMRPSGKSLKIAPITKWPASWWSAPNPGT